jgi:hypothetical protein
MIPKPVYRHLSRDNIIISLHIPSWMEWTRYTETKKRWFIYYLLRNLRSCNLLTSDSSFPWEHEISLIWELWSHRHVTLYEYERDSEWKSKRGWGEYNLGPTPAAALCNTQRSRHYMTSFVGADNGHQTLNRTACDFSVRISWNVTPCSSVENSSASPRKAKPPSSGQKSSPKKLKISNQVSHCHCCLRSFSFGPEGWSIMFLRNIIKHLPDCTASHPICCL